MIFWKKFGQVQQFPSFYRISIKCIILCLIALWLAFLMSFASWNFHACHLLQTQLIFIMIMGDGWCDFCYSFVMYYVMIWLVHLINLIFKSWFVSFMIYQINLIQVTSVSKFLSKYYFLMSIWSSFPTQFFSSKW